MIATETKSLLDIKVKWAERGKPLKWIPVYPQRGDGKRLLECWRAASGHFVFEIVGNGGFLTVRDWSYP